MSTQVGPTTRIATFIEDTSKLPLPFQGEGWGDGEGTQEVTSENPTGNAGLGSPSFLTPRFSLFLLPFLLFTMALYSYEFSITVPLRYSSFGIIMTRINVFSISFKISSPPTEYPQEAMRPPPQFTKQFFWRNSWPTSSTHSYNQ